MKFHGARRLALQLRSSAASSALSTAFTRTLAGAFIRASGALPAALSSARRWRASALRHGRIAVVSAVAVPALIACSSVPDEVNPVSWYEGVVGWFDEDEDNQEAEYDAGEDDDDDGDSWWFSDDDDEDEDDDDDNWWFGGDDDEDEEFAEDEGEFPNLASVPDRSAAARSGKVTEGLIADTDRPEYAPAVQRQGEAQLVLGAPQPAFADASGAAAQQQGADGYQPAPDAMPKAPVMSADLTQGGQGVQPPAPGLTPPPAPVFAAAPMAMPATPPYPYTPAGGHIVLTPPSSQPAGQQTQVAALGVTPLPMALTDTSSHHAFESFRAQMRQGGQGASFAYSPYTASGAGGYAAPAQTVVISSGGVSAVPAYGGGGFAGAAGGGAGAFVSGGGVMPSSSMAPGFAAQQGSGGAQTAAAQNNTAPASLSGFNVLNSPRTVLAPGSVKVATILFPNGSTSLKGEDRGILDQVASLQRQRGGTVRVIGHASSRTRTMDTNRHRRVNYEVSANRAGAVASALVRLGVPREVILVGAVSNAEPLFYEVMPSGEAGNRRTEIYLDT